jgi:hypothetical protein
MLRATILGAILALIVSGTALASDPPNPSGTRVIAGGGWIRETPSETRPEAAVSFSGTVSRIGPGTDPADYECAWRVRFQLVSVGWLNDKTVRTSGCGPVVLSDPADADRGIRCSRMPATLDGVDGYLLTLRLVDRGEPGLSDEVRIVLRAPDGNVLYDTDQDFSRVTAFRTSLDSGNVQIWPE